MVKKPVKPRFSLTAESLVVYDEAVGPPAHDVDHLRRVLVLSGPLAFLPVQSFHRFISQLG